MFVECPKCGSYEISPELYGEILSWSETDWRLERLRSEVENTAEPRMIWKSSTNIPEFATIGADKPTKLKKRFLRAKAEGRTVTVGTIFSAENADDESST